MIAASSRRFEVAIAASIVVAAYVAAAAYLPVFRGSGQRGSFYQEAFGPAVMQACGRGFVNPEVAPGSALASFLAGDSGHFDCDALPQHVPQRALEPFQRASVTLLWLAAVVWQTGSISWAALDLIAAALFSVSVAAAYIAVRLVSRPVVAALVTLLWATSPMHLGNIANLRDYAKTPFFTLMLATAALVAVERRPRRLLVIATLFGAAQAIGFGMRTDVILNFIPFVVVLFFARAEPPWQHWRQKVAAATLALAVFIVVALPVLRAYGESSALWHVSLLGLTTPFDTALNLRPALYDFGHLYNDGYISAVVSAFLQRLHPDSAPPLFATPAYDLLCAEYYRAIAATFPADILTRMIAATLSVLNLPFTITYGYAPAGLADGWVARAAEIRTELLLLLTGTGPLLLVVVIASIAARSLRLAAVVLLLTLAWCAYPFLQFQGRHVFHLELITLSLLGLVASLAVDWVREARHSALHATRTWLRGIAFVGAAALIIVAGVSIARTVQQGRAHDLMRTYRTLPREALAVRAERSDDGRVRLSVSDLFSSLPEGRVGVEYLVAEIVGGTAPSTVPLTIRYEDRDPRMLLDFSRSREVPVPAGGRTDVLFAAYAVHREGELLSRFVSVDVAEHDAARVRLQRVTDVRRIPLTLDVVLPEHWEQEQLAQRAYLGLLLPERVWLKAVQWWPQLSSAG